VSKKTLKAGTKIVFVENCFVGHYVVGDKATILSVCHEGSPNEHYEIELSSGRRSWAEEKDFKVKNQKPFKKATPKRIAKLEVGDIVLMRNGNEAKIIGARFGANYPIEHDKGGNGYMGCCADGTNCLGDEYSYQFDIVKVKNTKYKEEE